jgi:hypothetical protein
MCGFVGRELVVDVECRCDIPVVLDLVVVP